MSFSNSITKFTKQNGENNKMKQTANLTNGTTVYNSALPNFQGIGQVTDKDGKQKIRTFVKQADGTEKAYFVQVSDKWQPIPADAPKDVLDRIISTFDGKTSEPAENTPKTQGNGKGGTITPEVKDEKSETDFKPLSETETELKTKIEKEFHQLGQKVENMQLRQYELLSDYQDNQLYRAEYKTFAEAAKNVFQIGVNDKSGKYAFALAAVGSFYKKNKDFVVKNKLSKNAIDEIIVQQNKIAESLKVETNSPGFDAIQKNVIETISAAAKVNAKSKFKITPPVIAATGKQIVDNLANFKTEKTGSELLALAAETLGANKDEILTSISDSLTNTPKKEKTTSDATETANDNDSSNELDCEISHSTATIQMLDTLANTLTFECGCAFKLVKA